jgi:protein involved in polysaccharide export with SLBB domain
MRLHGWSAQCVPGRDNMKTKTAVWRSKCLVFVGIVAALLGSSGCVTFTQHAVPASRLPQQFQAPSKCNLHPVNFQLLSSSNGKDHLLDSGDVVAITIQGILPPTQDSPAPLLNSNQTLTRDYYPALGQVNSPNFGFPFHVQADGTLLLPEIAPVHVRGLTLQVATQRIIAEYVKKEILKGDASQFSLSLVKSRVNRVVVLREDASLESAAVIQKGSTILHKRGTGVLIDLPAKESDVLHALAASGGLPGVDAYNDIWVLRQSTVTEFDRPQVEEIVNGSVEPLKAIQQLPAHVKAIRIPLKICGGEPIPLS